MKEILLALLLVLGAFLGAKLIIHVVNMIASSRKADEISFAEFKAWVDGIIKEGDPRMVMSPMMATSMTAIAVLLTESEWRRERIWRKFNRELNFAKTTMNAVARLREELKEDSDEQREAD